MPHVLGPGQQPKVTVICKRLNLDAVFPAVQRRLAKPRNLRERGPGHAIQPANIFYRSW